MRVRRQPRLFGIEVMQYCEVIGRALIDGKTFASESATSRGTLSAVAETRNEGTERGSFRSCSDQPNSDIGCVPAASMVTSSESLLLGVICVGESRVRLK